MSTLKVNNLQVGQDATATNNFTWYQPSSPDGTVRLGVGNSGSATEKLRVNSDGQLKITGDSQQTNLIVDGAQTQLGVYNDSSVGEIRFVAQDGSGNNYTKYFTFHTENGAGPEERLRVTPSGKVLVNTTAVYSGEYLVVDSKNGTAYNSTFVNSSGLATDYCATTWRHTESGTALGYVGVGGSNVNNPAFRNTFVVGTQNETDIVFNTDDAERARISESGRMGFGIDPDNTGQTEPHIVHVKYTDVTNRGVAVECADSTNYSEMRFINDTSNYRVGYGGSTVANGDLQNKLYIFSAAAGKVNLTADHDGRILTPNQPFFYARRGGGSADGQSAGVISFPTVSYNVGGHFKTSAGTGQYERFTAPVAGTYLFAASPGYKQTNVDYNFYFRKNGANDAEGTRFIGTPPNSHSTSGATYITQLAVGDYVDIYVNYTHHKNGTLNYFCGYLLG